MVMIIIIKHKSAEKPKKLVENRDTESGRDRAENKVRLKEMAQIYTRGLRFTLSSQ